MGGDANNSGPDGAAAERAVELRAKSSDSTEAGANHPAEERRTLRAAAERRQETEPMTSFVESCLGAVADSVVAAERSERFRPRAKRLLRILHGRKNILVTTHQHPDPDALASSQAMVALLSARLPGAQVSMSIKGLSAGGVNAAFLKLSNPKLIPWDDAALTAYDAIILLDTQPSFAYSPLPAGITATAVIDHHRTRFRRPQIPFCDVRTDVGATGSIVFSYFMELEMPIGADLGASLLYAIESDLAGSAGAPGELDNIALSSLTLIANTRKLYQMRYVDLPQSYYLAYANGLKNAMYYDNALISYLDEIDSLEKPAVIADFLLRFDKVQWALVLALLNEDGAASLLLSLRTSNGQRSAADFMRRLVRGVGEGGGHQSKAGGLIKLASGSPTEIERVRKIVRRRYLRGLKIHSARGQKLVP